MYLFIYMLRGVFHVLSICVPYAFGVFRGLKGVGTSELELQLVVCLLVGTGNWIWVTCKCSLCCRWIFLWATAHISVRPQWVQCSFAYLLSIMTKGNYNYLIFNPVRDQRRINITWVSWKCKANNFQNKEMTETFLCLPGEFLSNVGASIFSLEG